MTHYDIVIVGSGIAGLSAALAVRGRARTLLVTKDALEEANTHYAQGGIAAALGVGDSTAAHFHDTIDAGAGLVDAPAAAILTSDGPDAIAELVRLGVPFDRDGATIALGQEAAHSAARIVHAGGDSTGAHVERALAQRIRAAGIDVREHTLVTRICKYGNAIAGVELLDCRTGSVEQIDCSATILATGGAGQLYAYTTNPAVATADGVALAYRAGAEVMDMEFIQFHPTALRIAGAPSFLISEAVRGEGALLRDCDGRAFMSTYDPRAELAPRDVVARAIQTQMVRTGAECVYLDLSHLPADHVRSRFPQIDRFCQGYGLDITRDLLPVAPAAHYTMGGVRTNAWGETIVRGLYACGEVACTGVHGANRLASNSLLEGLVFAHRTIDRILSGDSVEPQPADRGAFSLPPADAAGGAAPDLDSLQRLMWEQAGIVRTGDGLAAAGRTLAQWQTAANDAAGIGARHGVPAALQDSPTLRRSAYELDNLVLAGRLVVDAALLRRESRGAHYRADYPVLSPTGARHQVFRHDAAPAPDEHRPSLRNHERLVSPAGAH